ncbi:hypothetical protein X801_07855, partial [Opisthorchis viverrini]
LQEFTATGGSWNQYVERVNCFFLANEITDDKRKVNILLTICGSATYSLIRSLVSTDLPNTKTFGDLVFIVSKHYTPILSRFKFNTRVQKEGEFITDFVAELRSIMGHCDYGDFRNDMLRYRLVVGVRNARIQQCLLAESNLTLETAYDTAVTLEAAENNATLLQSAPPTVTSESVDSSYQVNRLQQPPNGTQFNCYRSGGRHNHPKDCRHTQTPIVLSCDASPYGVAAVLSQKDKSGILKPIAYDSRSLSPSWRNGAQIDKEALAILFG